MEKILAHLYQKSSSNYTTVLKILLEVWTHPTWVFTRIEFRFVHLCVISSSNIFSCVYRYILIVVCNIWSTTVIERPPFEVTEVGWGEFEIMIRIHFSHTTDRPLTLYHMIKLVCTLICYVYISYWYIMSCPYNLQLFGSLFGFSSISCIVWRWKYSLAK